LWRRKKDHQNLAVGNLGRIKDDLYRFGVAGCSRADILVVAVFAAPPEKPKWRRPRLSDAGKTA
jgi:hypothetical protein